MRAATLKTLVILSLAGWMGAPPLPAQPPIDSGLELEVRRLNETLGDMVELMRRQLEITNASVLMQRVQLMTVRIAPLEGALATARAEQRSEQSRLDDTELSESAFRGHLETQVEIGEITEEEARVRQQEHEEVNAVSRKQIEERLWAVQQRIIDLEQAIDARRKVLETWEGEIDRALGLP